MDFVVWLAESKEFDAIWGVVDRLSKSVTSFPVTQRLILYNWQNWFYGRWSAFIITNNPSLHKKHPGVLDGSDGSDRTSYPLTENYMIRITQVMGRIANLPPFLCARKVVTYMHHQNDTCVTLFAGAVDIL